MANSGLQRRLAARSKTHQLAAADGAVRGRPRPVEPDFSRDIASIHFDWSKTHLDEALIGEFAGAGLRWRTIAARAMPCSRARSSMRPRIGPPTHVAERGQGKPDDNRLAAERHARMRSLVDAIEGGAFGEIDSILHIGIGGSALGPDLLIDALGRDADRYEVRGRCPTSTARRSTKRPGASIPATTLVVARQQDLHHHRNADQPRRGARMAARGRGRRSLWPGDRGHRRARQGGRISASTKPASCRSARGSAGAIRYGRRSACRSRWRSAGARSRSCSRARPRWTAMSS